jgi:hypothetical protein
MSSTTYDALVAPLVIPHGVVIQNKDAKGGMGMTTRRKPLVQPKVRLRDDLHKRLSQAAKKAGRSLNQEIALRLEQSFSREEWKDVLGEERKDVKATIREEMEPFKEIMKFWAAKFKEPDLVKEAISKSMKERTKDEK